MSQQLLVHGTKLRSLSFSVSLSPIATVMTAEQARPPQTLFKRSQFLTAIASTVAPRLLGLKNRGSQTDLGSAFLSQFQIATALIAEPRLLELRSLGFLMGQDLALLR